MMPRFVALALITSASQVGAAELSQQAQCGIYATDAALEIPDSGTLIFLTAMRCGNNGQTNEADTKKCVIDASALIESVFKSVNSILKAVQHCSNGDNLNTPSAQCGMDVSKLVESGASLSGAVAGLATYCSPDTADLSTNPGLDNDKVGSLFHCLLGGADAMKSFLMIGMRAKQTADACNSESKQCTHRTLQLVGSLADMIQYALQSSAHCETPTNLPALCASKAIKLANALADIGLVGNQMTKSCSGEQSRLYLEGDDVIPSNSGSFVSLGLAALLPAVAALSFVAGSKWARATQSTMRDGKADVMVANLGVE